MAMLLPINKVRKTVRHYIANKIPFTYSTNRSNISVKCEFGSYSSDRNKFPPHELSFIKKVKRYVIDNDLHNQALASASRRELTSDPVYFAYGKRCRPGKMFDVVYNVDIKSAYWQTAYMMGLLSEEIYREGNDVSKISKKTRLAAIGSLAKKTTVYEYDGVKQRVLESKSEETEFLWNIITSKVGNVLIDVSKSLKEDLIFFWVDGIYLSSKSAANKAVSVFKKHGYDCQITKLESAEVTESHILVMPGAGEKIKPFYYGKDKMKI